MWRHSIVRKNFGFRIGEEMKKIRAFDILIIVMCIVAAILFKEKLYKATGIENRDKKIQTFEISLDVPYIEREIAEEVKKNTPVSDFIQGAYLGNLTNFEISEIEPSDFTFNNKILEFDKDEYVRMKVTFQGEGVKTENGVLIGTQNYLIGQTNSFGAGLVFLEEVRISELKYFGE